MSFKLLTLDSISDLEDFLTKISEGRSTFKYFEKRPLSIIQNHVVTLLLFDGNDPSAYGHLEEDNGVIWLGIAVADDMRGKGIGKKMMAELINQAKKKEIKRLVLTVGHNNEAAIQLYKHFGFQLIDTTETYQKFQLEL